MGKEKLINTAGIFCIYLSMIVSYCILGTVIEVLVSCDLVTAECLIFVLENYFLEQQCLRDNQEFRLVSLTSNGAQVLSNVITPCPATVNFIYCWSKRIKYEYMCFGKLT